MEGFLDEEWESLSKMFSLGDSDFFMHFNGNNVEIPPNFSAAAENVVDESIIFPSHDTHFYSISQESSNNSTDNQQPNGVNFVEDNTFDQSVQCYNMDCVNNNIMLPLFSDDVMEEILQLKAAIDQPAETGDSMQLKRKSEDYLSDGSPKKKSRVSKNTQKNKRVVQSKKKKKAAIEENEEEMINNDIEYKQNSISSSSSEDDSNIASQEIINGGSNHPLNSKGKERATRGSATDPQSLYARRRREKINERLRILQNLVPNGTKVDISTMLEEAVHYVKFLQLQIKLLSSDEMWMYAPIAYNGMDMGLYHKILPNLWP
ncbi:hypothetical protein BUALT_Bualt08G0043200 [Buddleja alternifolia]|uniref:BHLH domain-containing protein n=1 Tax=Buddleja alternifolia TaxID=168488 RepID=A0AAV6X3K9_9LAMI|nr:hypothetical protein BUALT_Bualt08G0043200 [Buddleja alternifolia]